MLLNNELKTNTLFKHLIGQFQVTNEKDQSDALKGSYIKKFKVLSDPKLTLRSNVNYTDKHYFSKAICFS